MDVIQSNFPVEILSKYEIIQEIGRGAFSVVYKVKSKSDNKIYCLKKINMKKTPDKENEINILSKLDHPNLVKYYYSYLDNEGVYIVMEFCEYGDLYSLLQSVKKKKVYVNEEIIWDVAFQTLLGLEYLHSKQVIHRDIKLLNLFMSKDKKIKIGDMGMSKLVKDDEMNISRVGTPLYLAPELIKKEKYDYKIDIWSFGCSIYHLAKTSPPYNDENLIKLGEAILNDKPSHLPSCYSQKLYDFILKLMTKNKNKRPSASEALKLIPEKEKRKLNTSFNNNDNSNNNNESNNKNSEQAISNMNSSNDMNNNIDNESDSKIDKKFNEKCLISGQTFYKMFKNNNDKKKMTNKLLENNLQNTIKNKKNDFLLLSKALSDTKEDNMSHGNSSNQVNINKNNNNIIKVTDNTNNIQENNQMKIIEEEKKEDLTTLNKEEIINNKPKKNAEKIQRNENERYINEQNNNNYNLNQLLEKSRLNFGKKYFSERKEKLVTEKGNDYPIRGAMKTFMLKGKNNYIFGNNIVFNSMVNNKKRDLNYYNHDLKNDINDIKVINSINFNKNNKENLVFPLIGGHDKRNLKNYNNKLLNENNNNLKSPRKNKYYPELNGNKFRKTINNYQFRNKLTIHDLK